MDSMANPSVCLSVCQCLSSVTCVHPILRRFNFSATHSPKITKIVQGDHPLRANLLLACGCAPPLRQPMSMSMSMSIINLYSAESWSISTALCVLSQIHRKGVVKQANLDLAYRRLYHQITSHVLTFGYLISWWVSIISQKLSDPDSWCALIGRPK